MIQVFLDTETTGVRRGYRPWEIALVRRDDEVAGVDDAELTIFIDVEDIGLAHADPFALELGGFERRHPQRGGGLGANQVLLSAAAAAVQVHRLTAGALIYGVNPSYDTIGLDALLERHGLEPAWYYVPQDITGLARGFLRGAGEPHPPRSSEALSLACGVELPAPGDRHTALGDARWVARWHDHLGLGAPSKALA